MPDTTNKKSNYFKCMVYKENSSLALIYAHIIETRFNIFKISNGNSGSKKFKIKVPTSIEDVPFRRQDRRILNARRKRMIDRSLIRSDNRNTIK